MINNRFQKTTLGFFAEIAIAKQISPAVVPASIALFVANAANGDLYAYWDDTNLPLAAGDTALAANSLRKWYYAWKQADGTYHRSAAMPTAGRKYSSVAYNAGTAMVKTMTFGGTYSLGQIVTIRVINTTQSVVPYPAYDYSVTIGSGGINAAVTALATMINAEKIDPLVTASSATNVLTITGISKLSNFTLTTYIETTTAQPTDATAPVQATTVAQVLPVGDNATMIEINRYMEENMGNPIYNHGGFLPAEFGTLASNVDSAIQFGFLLVTGKKVETGETRNYNNDKAYILIAIKSTDLATLAAL